MLAQRGTIMALALALQKIESSRRHIKWIYKVTPSSTYTTDGDTIDFTTATNPNALPDAIPHRVPADQDVSILAVKGGYTADFSAGTTLANAKMLFYSAAATQLTGSAAYPAGMTAAYIAVEQSRK